VPCLSVGNIFSLMLSLISYSHVMRNNGTRQLGGETLMAWFYFYVFFLKQMLRFGVVILLQCLTLGG
jgi:hypothetical protein